MAKMKMPRNWQEEVAKGFIKGVQIWAEGVFDRSQMFVPVDTGNLKQSGELVVRPRGFILIYRAPYAWVRENIVPKITAQKAPRGTHFVSRAIEAELKYIGKCIREGFRLVRPIAKR